MTARAKRPATAPAKRRGGGSVGIVDPTTKTKQRSISATPLLATFLRNMPGGYTGARTDRGEFAQWSVTDSGPHGDLLGDLESLRARSRDLERNEPLGGGAVQTMVDGVVGRGLDPKPRLDRELLGLDDATASAWERAASRVWWAFAGKPGCDLGGRHTFATLTEQTFRETLSGGDAFGLRRYAPQPGDVLGLKVHVLEAARISTPDFKIEDDFLRAGIRLNSDGAATSFFIADRYPAERFMHGKAPSWIEVPVRDANGQIQCLHVYRQTRPDQVRGVPLLAPVIAQLKQISRYSNAELMAAVVSAMFTVFIKNSVDGSGLADIDPDDENPVPAKNYKLGSGAMVDLDEGEDVTFADPGRPNAQFEPFFQAIVRQIGVGVGIPFEVLIKHFTASYSASRAALLQAWQTFLTRRSWLVASFCQPVYEWVLDEAIARGMLPAPGWRDHPLLRRAWANAEWTGPIMPSIDPLKEVNAAKERIALPISTLDREETELSGGDWEETLKQRKKENDMLREAGLLPAPTAAPAAAAAPAPGTDPDDKGDLETDKNNPREEALAGAS